MSETTNTKRTYGLLDELERVRVVAANGPSEGTLSEEQLRACEIWAELGEAVGGHILARLCREVRSSRSQEAE